MYQNFKNMYHLYTSFLANAWLRFPARKLTVIGVTGTDGKTTTVNLIYHILRTSGRDVSMISTVGAIIGRENYDVGFHVTTPSAFHIQKFMKQALGTRGFGDKYMVLEVTSHALDQNRVWGIPFRIGVITNVTPEHLDYHKTFENYIRTKAKLLQKSEVAILNRDDDSYEKVRHYITHDKKILTYGIDHKNVAVSPEKFHYTTKLQESYNQYNILAAITACRELGVPQESIREGIKTFKPPLGRGEIVYDKGFTVIIDFAHTSNAFRQVLSVLRPLCKGRLIHVFGSAGERDQQKRPVMGQISSEYADIILLTSEDPRHEDPKNIMMDIERGMLAQRMVELHKIIDRKKAIEKAISIAKRGDFILITGKAHEKSMNYGNGEEAWDEFHVVSQALEFHHAHN